MGGVIYVPNPTSKKKTTPIQVKATEGNNAIKEIKVLFTLNSVYKYILKNNLFYQSKYPGLKKSVHAI